MAIIYDGDGTKLNVGEDQNLILTSNLPVVFITSGANYDSITKEKNSNGTFTLVDCNIEKMSNIPIKFKLQGSGSLSYAKHNLNITFYDAEGKKNKYRFNSWYPTSKIHLKANEYDYSMVRNSVATRFAYKMMGKMYPKGCEGHINSFPCIMYYNGEYMGCHTINLPQDGKTYNFTDEAELACTNLAYRCSGTTSGWATNSNWEYRGDEDETSEMRDAFTIVHNIMSDYSNLTTAIIEQYFDKESLIAYWVLADIMLAVDSLINNWTIVTWDGIKWYHSYYDLDICFGLGGLDGTNLAYNRSITNCLQYNACGFWQKIVELYPTEIAEMYAKMRKYGADADTVYSMLYDFQVTWGWQNIYADRTKWASDKRNSRDISKSWITDRFATLDAKYGYTS